MTSTIVPALRKLRAYEKINVIDVGAARGAFMHELYRIFKGQEGPYEHTSIHSIGIDPFLDEDSDKYTLFIKACVDNIVGIMTGELYIHTDTQANSLCINKNNAGTVDEGGVIGDTRSVAILNLNDIIEEEFPEQIIHFIKIDAEGKDLDIVESLTEHTLQRVKFISMECINGEPRYPGERNKVECIEYMKSIKFDVCHAYDTDNGSHISDIVFMNREEL